MLEVDGVSVRFGKVEAVKAVSLSVPSGGLLGLIGPNGAGKTTLLRAIAGLQARAGVVRLLGEDLTFERQHLVGFTPDTPPVYEELTVRKFLRFVGLGYGLSDGEIEDRTAFWLDKVWLAEKADQKLKGLSRGMRQRVGIARTMMANPPLVLLDEPAAGLDPAGRVQFRELLVSLRDQGKALIVSSHILSDLAEYCTHVGMMSAGQLKRVGTVESFLSRADDHRRRYELRLARPVAQFEDRLGAIESISAVRSDGRLAATFDYHQADEAAGALLAALVRDGWPICEFGRMAVDLEQAYLREGIHQVD